MSNQNKTIKTTMIITLIIMVSKIAGLAREMILAAYFGQSMDSDAYITSYGIISIFTILFGAAISSTFIPIYTKTRLQQGESEANNYASNILNLYILCAILTSVLGYLFAPQICGLIWQGSSEALALIVKLSRLMFPSLVFWAVTGVFVNLLNARKQFIPEQLVGFALSFCVIIASILFQNITVVALATTIAAALQIVILFPFIKKQFVWKKTLTLKDKRVKRTFLLALPALISVAFDEVNHQADRFFGSALEQGAVSALQRSYTLVQAAVSVLVIPITTIMFSELSHYVALKQMNKLKNSVRKTLEAIMLITLPLIIISIITRNDLIALFYQRGRFSADDTLFTAPVFALYILGLFAFGVRTFLTRVFFSLQYTKDPMIMGMIAVGINIVLDLILKDILGTPGLTLATSIASSIGAILLFWQLRKRLGQMSLKKSLVQAVKILLSSAVCAVLMWLFYIAISTVVPGDTFFSQLIRFLLSTVFGLVVYTMCALILKVESAIKLKTMFLSKFQKKPPLSA